MSRRLSAVLFFCMLVLVAIALVEPFSNSAASLARSNSKFVSFDVLPGQANKVLTRHGNPFVPVAIYSSSTFDATSVDPSTIRFANAQVIKRANGKLKFKIKDVNNDGRDDLLAFVWAKDLRLAGNAGVANLSARSFDGSSIAGSQLIQLADNSPSARAPEKKNFSTKYTSRFDDPPLVPNVDVTFCNTAGITINNLGPATPQPSDRIVSGLPTAIAKVTVTLNGFTHNCWDDVDIVLQSPVGGNDGDVAILSDVGGCTQAPPAGGAKTITLDDAAATSMTAAPLATGTFKPTNLEGDLETFVLGPQVPRAGTTLSTYNGSNPNGTWRLWVQDDTGGDAGSIASWCLTFTTTPTAADNTISGAILDNGGAAVPGTVVTLSGSQSRKTITDAKGFYQFDEVETSGFYTVTPSRANYSFSPSNRSFSQLGNHTDAAFTGSSSGDNLNPLDTPEYFVRQQYLDILGREPDVGGFNYWSNEILRCGVDTACTNARRRDVAAAFFIEDEFQDTGSYIYDAYKGALGRKPVFSEYSADRKKVIGGPNLGSQKAAFADGFVQRSEFVTKYQGNTTSDSFVDALLTAASQSAGVDLSGQRAGLIAKYNSGGNMNQSRSLVLQQLADNAALKAAEYNAAFVLTEYFSYLQRNPEPEGYDFWLNVINNGDVGNYRGMVCSFVTSTEYQKRFSSVITHTNAECGN